MLSPVASLKGVPTPITSPKSVILTDDKKSLSDTSAVLVETAIIDETKPSTSGNIIKKIAYFSYCKK